MADLTVARLLVSVGADLSDLNRGMGQAEGAVTSFVGTAQSASSKLGTLFTGAAVAGVAGLAAGFGASTKAAMDFEKTISGVLAVGGKEAASMRKEIEALALKLGADTSFSATAAAEGIEELVKAGVNLSDIMGGAAKASLDLAAAGGISVADAATIASDAMNMFGIKGSEMAGVADLIAGAANASSIDVGQFKYSLQAAGSVAATVGLSFTDTATAIAVLGQEGIKGADAGTSLKTMLMSLQPQTKEQTKLFRELGLMTADGSNKFFDAHGNIKSMAEVSQTLQEALKGQTKQQQLATLQTLFGTDAVRAAAIFTKAGAKGFKEMAEAMAGVSAADVAEERLNNLSGSLEKLKGSLSTAAITIGMGLTPHLKRLVDWATSVLNAWMPAISAFATALPAAIDRAADAFGSLINFLGLAIDGNASIGSLTVALAAVPAPLREVAAWVGITANNIRTQLQVAVSWLYETGLPLAVGAVGVLSGYLDDVLVPMLATAWEWLSPQLGKALDWLASDGFPMLRSAIGAVGAWLQSTWIPTLQAVWTWLSPKLGAALDWLISDGWPMLRTAASGTVAWFSGTAVPALQGVWTWLAPKIGTALSWLATDAWPALRAAASVVVSWVLGTGVPALTGWWTWLSPKIGAALTWLTTQGWPLLQGAGAAVASWVTGTLFPALSEWWAWLNARLAPVYTWFITYGWPSLQAAGSAVWTWLTGTLFPALSAWYAWLQDRLSPIYSWFITYGWPALQNAGAVVWGWLTTTLFPALREWWVWLQERLSPIYSWFITYAWPSLQAAGSAVWTWLTGTLFPTLREWWVWLQDRLSPIYSWFIDYAWPTLQSAGGTVVSWITQELYPALREWWVWFQDRLSPVFTWFITYGWPKLLDGATSYADFIAGPFIKTIGNLYTELKKTDALESWVTIFENLSKFAHYLVSKIDLGGWFSKVGSGAGAVGAQMGYVAQAIAWISRALAQWSKLLPGVNVPALDDPPKAPTGGGGGGGGGLPNVEAPPARIGFGGGGSGRGGGGGGSIISPNPPSIVTPSPGGGSGGGGGGGSPAPGGDGSDIDNSSRSAFVRTAAPYMLQAAGGNKDLASMMLAAAISENGSVGSGGSFWANNFFGIKGEGPAGKELVDTWEWVNGQRVYIKDWFAKFSNPVEGMGGFMWFLKKNPRYSTALANFERTGDAIQLFKDVNAAGYATNPTWWKFVSDIREGQVRPVTGYARGGWAGLNGPELAILGERGPEYVVPNDRLSRMGGDIYLTIVVQGNALASRTEIADAVIVGLRQAQVEGRTRMTVV